MLAGNVEDHIVGRVAELRPIVFRAELLGMPADRGGMRGEMGGAAALLMRLAGVEERVQRAFRVDDQLLAAGQAHDHVGAQPPVLGVHRNLGLEIGVLRQAGLFEHVAQALLAPAAARLGAGAQRIDQLGGLVAHLGVAGMELLHRLAQRLIAAYPLFLDFAQALLVARERLLHRGEQRLHLRFVALPRLGEALIGALEEALLRFAEDAVRQLGEAALHAAGLGLEAGQLDLGAAEIGGGGLELRLAGIALRAHLRRRTPAQEHAEAEPRHERGNRNQNRQQIQASPPERSLKSRQARMRAPARGTYTERYA